jgi:hypothetical protein
VCCRAFCLVCSVGAVMLECASSSFTATKIIVGMPVSYYDRSTQNDLVLSPKSVHLANM